MDDSNEILEVPDPRIPVLQAAFRSMDEVELCYQFRQRAVLMKSVTEGGIEQQRRSGTREGLEIVVGAASDLYRSLGGGKIEKSKFIARSGRLIGAINLVAASELRDDKAARKAEPYVGLSQNCQRALSWLPETTLNALRDPTRRPPAGCSSTPSPQCNTSSVEISSPPEEGLLLDCWA